MNDVITIFHFLGLGDHIICNGLVRNLIQSDKSYRLVVKDRNLDSVKFMYRDLDNLDYYVIGEEVYPRYFIETYKRPKIYIDFTIHHNLIAEGMAFDEAFYHQLKINFDKRWSDFYVDRDACTENDLFKKLNPTNEPYALVHNNTSDGVDRINYDFIATSLKQINVCHSKTIFDYIKLIENASEIHCVDSSFLHLVESVVPENIKLFYHKKFKQKYGDFITHSSRKNWTEI